MIPSMPPPIDVSDSFRARDALFDYKGNHQVSALAHTWSADTASVAVGFLLIRGADSD